MIAVDTSILIYAHREDAPFHEAAKRCVTALAEGRAPWAIPWPCVHEFLGVVTRPRLFRPPTPLDAALAQIEAWVATPALVLLAEGPGYWSELRELLAGGRIVGPAVHDARIVALCRAHGVRELWTADRDFSRLGGVVVRNPLLTDAVRDPPPRYRRRIRARA
jgi:toxin-antitoxin system PIN domain toxin